MSEYKTLDARLKKREVIILDGAVGTQLQKMGVPMSGTAWAAMALKTHPFTVRRMHENYIKAGCDVITVNTYSAMGANLVPLGLADEVRELNLRAVMLAMDARDRHAKDRPVYIAGSVSNYGLRIGIEKNPKGHGYYSERVETSEAQAKAYLREQAETLAEAGVDLMLAESTGGTTHRRWVFEACTATGLPVWAGFKVHQDKGDKTPRVGYHSKEPFADTFDDLVKFAPKAVCVFHSPIAATNAALPIVRKKWKGPVGAYPEAERHDYVAVHRDRNEPIHVSPKEFVKTAKAWVADGVQIIGGCCGIELEYIQPLREALPARVPA
jgi:homocysteine S-methyltransferase